MEDYRVCQYIHPYILRAIDAIAETPYEIGNFEFSKGRIWVYSKESDFDQPCFWSEVDIDPEVLENVLNISRGPTCPFPFLFDELQQLRIGKISKFVFSMDADLFTISRPEFHRIFYHLSRRHGGEHYVLHETSKANSRFAFIARSNHVKDGHILVQKRVPSTESYSVVCHKI